MGAGKFALSALIGFFGWALLLQSMTMTYFPFPFNIYYTFIEKIAGALLIMVSAYIMVDKDEDD